MSHATRSDPLNLLWVDMEMTGLDPDNDRIIEIAIIVTDPQLNILAESEALAIHQSDACLSAMDNWNTATHGKSGLTARVRASTLDEDAATAAMIEFVSPWVPKGLSPMCGNTIHQDRRFMARHMPRLEAYFHYRNIDVSTLKELGRRWCPEVIKAFRKRSAHTALADIRESIEELRHYREKMMAEVAAAPLSDVPGGAAGG
ncbi:MAG: oligoribonuclease [Burkholderiaceae bacterium]